jgi:hypothetical protein
MLTRRAQGALHRVVRVGVTARQARGALAVDDWLRGGLCGGDDLYFSCLGDSGFPGGSVGSGKFVCFGG